MRGVVTRLVELSTRAYGVIYSALPDDLKLQATKGADVPANFAYGLWTWLERKFQSTELDNIGNLLDQWTSMRQGEAAEDESFDAYLARVNQLRSLLEHAGEKPSHNMYAYTLLWKLQPRYNVAVLTLKAQRHLDKADKIDWSHVSAFINGFERDMVRFQSAEGGAASAAAAWSAGGGRSGGKGKSSSDKRKQDGAASKPDSTSGAAQQSSDGKSHGKGERKCYRCNKSGHTASECSQEDKRTCFRCDKRGHVAAQCRAPHPAGTSSSDSNVGSSGTKRDGEQASMAVGSRFHALAESDSEGSEQANAAVVTERSYAAALLRGMQAMSKATAKKEMESMHSCSIDAHLARKLWGWDTMASALMSNDDKVFTALRACIPAVPVKVADSRVIHVTQIGSVALKLRDVRGVVVPIVLHDVLYDKRFACNLLSGELLRQKLGWEYHGSHTGSFVITPCGHKVKLSTQNRVAVLLDAGVPRTRTRRRVLLL
jgi:hypothetical protein